VLQNGQSLDAESEARTVGLPGPGQTDGIVDPAGRPVPDGQPR